MASAQTQLHASQTRDASKGCVWKASLGWGLRLPVLRQQIPRPHAGASNPPRRWANRLEKRVARNFEKSCVFAKPRLSPRPRRDLAGGTGPPGTAGWELRHLEQAEARTGARVAHGSPPALLPGPGHGTLPRGGPPHHMRMLMKSPRRFATPFPWTVAKFKLKAPLAKSAVLANDCATGMRSCVPKS